MKATFPITQATSPASWDIEWSSICSFMSWQYFQASSSRPLSASAPISARSAPMMSVEPLGSSRAQLHRFLGVLDGGAQLALPVADGGEHLPGPDAQAGGFGGHGVVQQVLHELLAFLQLPCFIRHSACM